MGWFWGPSPPADPTKSLDPSLREFLDRETPPEPPPSKRTKAATAMEELKAAEAARASPDGRNAAGVPAQSLYQDGRFADIWKTYTPLTAIQAETKNDQERLRDLIDDWEDTKIKVAQTARENCSFEEMAQNECFKHGPLSSKMTMCLAERRAMNRCYEMQMKFLRALGYLNVAGDEEAGNEVQMHAYALYHKMLDQEKLRKDAKKRGEPEPELAPVMSRQNLQKVLPAGVPYSAAEEMEILESVTQVRRERYQSDVNKMTVEERELELRLIAAEARQSAAIAARYVGLQEEQKEKRQARAEAGKSTFGDKVFKMWGRE
ncbi:hypothetical protein K402DRAFT_348670 [Aulographum hederae CBS 113979]|uniref:Uncharacterized protein n=1 Tax=Aulographum hederae CBS 113979 TaxID=1176131 RepID=A0A6G1HBB1_9PEZI|nr:hypothetical protein K402DRAFT_348670 [Aulographum hederae CBS 113979]